MALGALRPSLVAVALATSLIPAVGVAQARRAAPTTAVGVGAREYRFALYRASVPPGMVHFNLANRGEDGHDLVVLDRSGRQLARLGEVRPGHEASLSVRLAPGTYKLRCDLSDHAHRGMHTTIRVAAPSR